MWPALANKLLLTYLLHVSADIEREFSTNKQIVCSSMFSFCGYSCSLYTVRLSEDLLVVTQIFRYLMHLFGRPAYSLFKIHLENKKNKEIENNRKKVGK